MNERSLTKDILHTHWVKGERLLLNGKLYRVGKMSYGDYFIEPKDDRNERSAFSKGTRWPKVGKVKNKES